MAARAPRLSVPGFIAWPAANALEKNAKLIGKKESPLINKYRGRAVKQDHQYSAEKAKRELGYGPAVTTRDGIRLTVAWYQHHLRSPHEAA